MPKKILIVEDEANIRELLRLYLEREGYTVLEAENGVEGIKKWKSDKPDMLLLDVMMPGMDGLTARRLADKTGCSTQPIFRIYENMNELHEEAFAMAIAYYTDFYRAFMKDRPIEKPFVNFGLHISVSL